MDKLSVSDAKIKKRQRGRRRGGEEKKRYFVRFHFLLVILPGFICLTHTLKIDFRHSD